MKIDFGNAVLGVSLLGAAYFGFKSVQQATQPLRDVSNAVDSASKNAQQLVQNAQRAAGTVYFTEAVDKAASARFAGTYGRGYVLQTVTPGQTTTGTGGQLIINDPRYPGGVAVYPKGSSPLDVLFGTGGYSSSPALLKKSGVL